ncbi:MAG: hypothetical protein FJW39_10980 [Acidobacteria bacterium]|nr:hypothetical protein [Acidobacteriota bacterium]
MHRASLLALFALAAQAEPGLTSRVPWTTSKVTGSPEPPSPYQVELAFPSLKFQGPTVITSAPGTNRLFVGDRDGRIFSFEPRRDVSTPDLFLDLGEPQRRQIMGVAFHPEYARNGFFYAFITENKPLPRRTRIARFERSRHNPLRADPASEAVIIEFPSAGHNGGALKFGPDGYLYIGTGDGGGQYDPHNTGQFVGDLLSSILRIDVNRTHSAKLYGIPADNPFRFTPGALPEIFAFGFRQPWKMSFDRKSGDLWAGEVGQDLWESIYLVRKGGNYGWSVSEGPQMARPDKALGPTPISLPVVAHSHSEARSITGGYVYHGERLPELRGAYIYADWETGRIWALRHEGGKMTWHQELDDTTIDIADFAEDHAGELYMMTHHDGRIYQLAPRHDKTDRSREFPRLLSETGLFRTARTLDPMPGLIPYSVNSPLWSDGADKQRFLAVPGDAKIRYASNEQWLLPEGSVLVKTFSLGGRRIETRLLVLLPGDATREQWVGYVYVWNDAQTDAELLPKGSLEKTYTVNGQPHKWYFPSRNDCLVCHNEKARFVLGLNAWQMNRNHDYGGKSANQIETLQAIGMFDRPPRAAPDRLPRLPDPSDSSVPLEQRARSYLHANCAHCHQFGAGGNSDIRLLYPLALKDTATVGADSFHGAMGTEAGRIITAGSPEQSVLYRRLATRESGRMPHIASNAVDQEAVKLIGDWIRAMR